jgi:PAS domain S-box-containing protein
MEQDTLQAFMFHRFALDQAAILAVTDRTGNITEVNDRFCQISKYSPAELVGQNYRILNTGYHPPEFFQTLWGLISAGNIWRGEILNRAKDGSVYWVATTIVPHCNAQGEPFQYMAIQFDITQQKQMEEHLRVTQERWELALRGNNDGIWDWNIKTNEVFFSERWKTMLGYSNGEVPHHIEEWKKRLHPDDVASVLKATDDHLKHKTEFYSAEYRIRCKSGHYKWILDRGQALWDDQGQPVRMAGSHTDISDRKDAEQKIRNQAALLDVATDAIMLRDLEDHILYWNKGAERLYGWTAAEAIGQNATALLCPEATAATEQALQILRQKGQWRGELSKVCKDGRSLLVDSRWTLICDEQGYARRILTVGTDITARHQLEKQIIYMQRLESLGTLASGIAHDLNNILSPILAISQLLPQLLPQLDSRSQNLLTILSESALRGRDLVTQILTFAQGAEGQRVPLQLNDVMMEVFRAVQSTFPATIEIASAVDARSLWPVSADATQLHQVLMNLCVNARDAMPEGGQLCITAENRILTDLDTRLHLDAKAGAYVVVTVTDTGMGMLPEQIDRIFEPFFTTKAAGKGTGLGLSTSFKIVKNHGGFITVASQVNQGTQFSVYLPAMADSDRN